MNRISVPAPILSVLRVILLLLANMALFTVGSFYLAEMLGMMC